MKTNIVFYHADCTDGFAAAYSAYLKLGDTAEYIPCAYGKPAPLESMYAGKLVFILDFSFPFDVTHRIFEMADGVVWLDHHKTAFEMIGQNMDTPYIKSEVGKSIVLDNGRSGAMLAWNWFHPYDATPELIRHIDDRDRWQFNIPRSRDIHAALASLKPWSFEQWGKLVQSIDDLEMIGETLLRSEEQHVKSMCEQMTKCKLPELGSAVNATLHISEVGHALANESGTYGLVWYMGQDRRAKCSLRSNGTYDVSSIAKRFGGGGHLNAAGFEIDMTTLLGWLK